SSSIRLYPGTKLKAGSYCHLESKSCTDKNEFLKPISKSNSDKIHFGKTPKTGENISRKYNKNENMKPLKMRIFPSPVKHQLNFKFTKKVKINSFKIISSKGKIVYKNTPGYVISSTLNVSEIEPGVYFIKATNHNKIFNKRFIVH
ncbi:MAG: T9SS type A sorting domain-containing protein, partial [Flavobacteriales bacterium]